MGSNTNKLIRASLMLAVAIVFQIIGRNIPEINQFLVGSAINCILILTAFLCGRWWGVGVGILTPVLAWLVGQLNPVLAPFIPFIMVGNFFFVFLFSMFSQEKLTKRGIGVITGALLKFGFLTLASSKLVYVFKLNLPSKVLTALAVSMSLPQLITALIGGTLGLIIIELLVKRKVI
ncbi:MAG: ECF transporter S component [Bacillota bacterium]|nr:ECF transporter S component [Bacillota bacterium]